MSKHTKGEKCRFCGALSLLDEEVMCNNKCEEFYDEYEFFEEEYEDEYRDPVSGRTYYYYEDEDDYDDYDDDDYDDYVDEY